MFKIKSNSVSIDCRENNSAGFNNPRLEIAVTEI